MGSWVETNVDGPTGRLHIVMTRIPGVTLRELAEDPPSEVHTVSHKHPARLVSMKLIVKAFKAVAERLIQLHEADWLLNDINLGSVLVDPSISAYEVGLVDFGQASPGHRPTAPGWGQHYPSEILRTPPSPARDTAILAATLKLAVKTLGKRRWEIEEKQAQVLLEGCMRQQEPARWFAASLREWGWK